MPAVTKKRLYLGKTISELNKRAGQMEKIKDGQCRMFLKSSDKVLEKAQEAELDGDDERAYVLFMKCCNIFQGIMKTPEYKKSKNYFDGMWKDKFMKALNSAEKLADELKQRYDELEAETVAEKLNNLDSHDSYLNGDVDPNTSATEEKKEDIIPEVELPEPPKEPERVISSEKLYSMLNDSSMNLIIMDARSSQDYEASHIADSRCISVPNSCIIPGCTSAHIEVKLGDRSREHWDRRHLVDYIVLLDWMSSELSLSPPSTISSLKDAIFKWDQDKVLKSEPLVLDGGYNDWLYFYPTYSTDPHVKRPATENGSSSKKLPSLDEINYEDAWNILKPPPPKVEPVKAEQPSSNGHSSNFSQTTSPNNRGQPSIPDRSKKPQSGYFNNLANNNPKNANELEKGRSSIKTIHNDLSLDSRDNKNYDKDTFAHHQNGTETENVSKLPAAIKTVAPNDEVEKRSNLEPRKEASVPKMPDRTLKPASSVASKPADEVKTSRDAEEDLRRQQEREEAERDLERLRELKAKEAKEAADLMREKKKILDELEKLRTDREKTLQSNDMEKPQKRQGEANDTPITDQKPSQSNGHVKDEEAMKKEEELQIKQQEIEKQEHLLKEQMEQKQREIEENEKKLRAEAERKAREEEEARRQLEINRQKRKEEERRRVEEEQQLQRKREEEQRRAEEERRKREEDAARIKASEQRSKPSVQPGVATIPKGWEKRYDPNLKKAYYIDHNTKTTHWELPAQIPKPTASTSSTYQTVLKDEPSTSSGMKRSHSSPNIAKMMQDEEERKNMPAINRDVKPKLQQPVPGPSSSLTSAKVRNFAPTWGSVSAGLTGLRNQGNTCYMNSTLQCLSNTTFLTHYFLKDAFVQDVNRNNVMGTGGKIAEELAMLIKTLWSGQYKSVTPRDFRMVAASQASHFGTYEQQDSHDFLANLLDWLHEDLNLVERRQRIPEQNNDSLDDETAAKKAWEQHKLNNSSIVVSLFQGQFKSTLTCNSCGKKSVTFDSFMYLLLEVPTTTRCTLRDCIINFSKEEKMTGDSRWNCPQCKCKRVATKRIVIWKLPPICIVMLKRFNQSGMWHSKNSAHVEYPLENFEMHKFASGPQKPAKYQLYGLSLHHGASMETGHYTALCTNSVKRSWYNFDDSEVYEVSRSEVSRKTQSAYILFYSSL